jgi:hypothetical protein
LELGDGRFAAVFVTFLEERCMFGTRDSGVCEEKVDIALFFFDLVRDVLERLFVGYVAAKKLSKKPPKQQSTAPSNGSKPYVADYGFDGAVDCCFGGFFESFFAATDDVDCFCSVGVQCSGCV